MSATSFLGLSLARVGVGEATATPCSHSLIGDIIPQQRRASALAVYHTGTYGGAALSLIVGALFVQHWGSYCHTLPITGACTIAGWRAALIAVALPPLTVVRIYTLGGRSEALRNLAVAAVLIVLAVLLSKLCGIPPNGPRLHWVPMPSIPGATFRN